MLPTCNYLLWSCLKANKLPIVSIKVTEDDVYQDRNAMHMTKPWCAQRNLCIDRLFRSTYTVSEWLPLLWTFLCCWQIFFIFCIKASCRLKTWWKMTAYHMKASFTHSKVACYWQASSKTIQGRKAKETKNNMNKMNITPMFAKIIGPSVCQWTEAACTVTDLHVKILSTNHLWSDAKYYGGEELNSAAHRRTTLLPVRSVGTAE